MSSLLLRSLSKNTARSFYAASIFFEILKQFGDCPEDVDTKRVYSKWKSADIVKAIREGRRPTPPATVTLRHCRRP